MRTGPGNTSYPPDGTGVAALSFFSFRVYRTSFPKPVVQHIFQRLFRQRFGQPASSVLAIEGDGSSRAMYRLIGPDYQTAVAVVGPDREEKIGRAHV